MDCALERKIEDSDFNFNIEEGFVSEIPTEALKKMSDNWSHKQWGEYLENMDTNLKEDNVFDHAQIENLSATNYAETVFSFSREESQASREAIKRSLKSLVVYHLSKREREVIWCRFWQSLTATETAKKLGLSRSSVRTLEQRARDKMSSALFKKSFKNSNAFKHLNFI